MRPPLVEQGVKRNEAVEEISGGREQVELKVQNTRLAEALRKAELRLSIEASTARILNLALSRGSEPDPELL